MSSQRLSAHLVSRGPSIMRHCILTWTAPAPITALLPFSPSPPTETPPISASPLFSAADGSAPSATGGTGGGGASGIAAVGKLGSSSISNGLPAAAAVLAWVAGGKAVLGGGAAIALWSLSSHKYFANEPICRSWMEVHHEEKSGFLLLAGGWNGWKVKNSLPVPWFDLSPHMTCTITKNHSILFCSLLIYYLAS